MNKKPGAINRWIRPLPERLVNKIAAGEVIERPAAVLKELVENSFDSDATRIDIIIEKSGTKLISVMDNGCGILPEQVEIAFSRHATSKISNFDDLENLRSFGFRGEALPSIGSISKTRMVTKFADSETGTEIIIEGGVVQSVKPIAAPPGTKIEVSDLFFNTPARRKFLKTEMTEARHLSRNAIALALSKPGIAMTCRLNERKIFSLDESITDEKKRVSTLLFGNSSGKLFEIESESSIMKVKGFLSYPENCRQNRQGLYLFINNRFISSPTMFHAVTSGYGELLPKGHFPVGAIFLNVDPLMVDVNVHPTKAEVRLSEERAMHDILYQAVKRVIRGTGELSSSRINMENVTTMSSAEAIKRVRDYQPRPDFNQIQTDLEKLYGALSPDKKAFNIESSDNPETIKEIGQSPSEVDTEQIGTEIDPDRLIFLGQLSDLYLLFKASNQLLIVDQHTAHERILFEENIKAIETGSAISQNLLFPLNIELPADLFAQFEESIDIINAAGFIVEPFGQHTVLLNAVPASLSKKSPEKIFNEIMEDISNFRQAGHDIKKAVAQSAACRGAVMAGDRLTGDEAMALMRQFLVSRFPHFCPHGRPIILKISKDELDAKFGRK